MTGTMTWAAMDVHARSTHCASLEVQTGELSRRRFDTGALEPVLEWLSGLPAPVHACYEAGPTGYGLYRAARAAGIGCVVIAPSKTPRASGDKVKNDRKDTEHLLRQLMAGALTPIAVPTPSAEAARDLARAREQVRGDLMRARHRLSKLLLRHGRVWDASTWTEAHERWLGSQKFDQVNTELAYVAREDELWGTVSRLRAFRGIDTLSALVIVLEVGDFQRFPRAVQLAPGWDWCPPASSPARQTPTVRSPRPARATPDGSSSKPPGTTSATANRRDAREPPREPARPHRADRLARPASPAPRPPPPARPQEATERRQRRRRSRARLLHLGRRHQP